MKFSVVITILNEEKSILPLLDSLAHQTLKPGEIILVDAGSTDQTKLLVRRWAKEHRDVSFQLIELEGSNRSVGRNHGINAARYEHIAITDAGCEADKLWLSYLQAGFKDENISVVAGYYISTSTNMFSKLFSFYTSTMPKDFNAESFLPSSRSIAFTKKAWGDVGGYPEYLDTCEDLVFARDLKKTQSMITAPHAVVYWHQARSLGQYYWQIYGYARGDVSASYVPHVIRIITVYLRYTIFSLYPLFFLLYLFYAPIKFWKVTYKDGSFFILPLVQIVTDIAVMCGGIAGLKQALKHQLGYLR